MILFNLICGQDHEFEAWFRNGAAYDSLEAAGEVTCPICEDRAVRKAPMAPGVITGHAKSDRAEAERGDGERSNSAGGAVAVGGPVGPERDQTVAALQDALTELRRRVEESCDYVGDRFPEEARRIHYGEAEERAIYGNASLDEARALCEEGVELMLIPKRARRDS